MMDRKYRKYFDTVCDTQLAFSVREFRQNSKYIQPKTIYGFMRAEIRAGDIHRWCWQHNCGKATSIVNRHFAYPGVILLVGVIPIVDVDACVALQRRHQLLRVHAWHQLWMNVHGLSWSQLVTCNALFSIIQCYGTVEYIAHSYSCMCMCSSANHNQTWDSFIVMWYEQCDLQVCIFRFLKLSSNRTSVLIHTI